MTDRMDKIVNGVIDALYDCYTGVHKRAAIRVAIAEAVGPLVEAIKSHGDYDDGCTCPSCTKVTAALVELEETGNVR